jgi:drug/metabolite transporter (DMT)-like permease
MMMLALHIDPSVAGLGTAMLWSFSALSWSIAGRRVGSVPVASLRLAMAASILLVLHRAMFGTFWPAGIDAESMALLLVSGALGTCFADLCLFRGLVLIGPRQGMLIQSLCPIATALVAFWSPMHEMLGWRAILGITLTVSGIAWVLAEHKGRQAWKATPRQFALGILLCLAAVAVVSVGNVLTRMGLAPGRHYLTAGPPRIGVEPFSGGMVRVVAGTVMTWLILPLMRQLRPTIAALRDRRAMLVTTAGTIVGPVIGIWLSMIAFKGAKTGIAAALINTTPLMLIPIVYFAYGERPTIRTLFGTCVAVGGIFLLVMK